MSAPLATLAGLSLFFVGSVYAQGVSGSTCEGVSCFNQAYALANAKSIDIRHAPKLAWRPGHYQSSRRSGSRSRSNRGILRTWFSAVPSTGPANPRGTFVFYTGRHSYGFYDASGNLVKSGPASGGMSYCPDVGRSCRTPVGQFRVYSKGPVDCVSRKYPLGEGGAPMPHCMYFRGGYAVHGSYHVPNYHASHGCIRLHPSHAANLYGGYMRVGTVVVVKPY